MAIVDDLGLAEQLAELPSSYALRYASPQIAWAHGVRQSAPLGATDAKRLRQKMCAAYAAWTGFDLEGDLHTDRFPPKEDTNVP